MEPVLAVTTDVDVSAGNLVDQLTGAEIYCGKPRPLVVAPQKLWISTLCLIASLVPAYGTALVMLVTPGEIILAADSTLTAVSGGVSTFDGKTCKIRREGRRVYGAVGDYGTPGTEMDIWGIAKNAVKNAKTIKDIFRFVEPEIFRVVPELVRRSKIEAPESYKKWLTGVPVVSIIFAGFEKRRPVVFSVDFTIDTTGMALHPKRMALPEIPGSVYTSRYGNTTQMTKAIGSAFWRREFLTNHVEAARDLIQREIDAGRREKRYDVGPPISIVALTANGIDRPKGYEGVCSEK